MAPSTIVVVFMLPQRNLSTTSGSANITLRNGTRTENSRCARQACWRKWSPPQFPFSGCFLVTKKVFIVLHAVAGLAMSIGTSKSSMARSTDSALSIPEFDLQLLERSFDDVQSEAGTEVAAANCWNPLPNEVKNAESLASFRRQLKTHLFKQAFFL